MLEVLYEVTALLVKCGGVRDAPVVTTTAVNPRQSRRASMKTSTVVRLLLLGLLPVLSTKLGRLNFGELSTETSLLVFAPEAATVSEQLSIVKR